MDDATNSSKFMDIDDSLVVGRTVIVIADMITIDAFSVELMS